MRSRGYIAAVIGAGLLLAGVTLPVAYLVIRAMEVGPAEFQALVFRPRNLVLLRNTLGLLVGVLACSTLLAFPLAWLTSRANMTGKRFWALAGVLPLAIPSYLMAYAMLAMGGNMGAVAQLTDWVMPRISGYWGALFILTLCNFPYLFFNLRAALLTLDPTMEEVGYSLGQGHRQILTRVLMPQLRPAFLSGSLLISLHVISDFAAVSLMRYETLSYALYTQYNSAFNRSYAACLALMLIAMTVILLIAESRFLRRLRYDRVGSAGPRKKAPAALGKWAPVAYGYVIVLFLISVVAPVGTMIYWALKADMVSLLPDLRASLIGSVMASFPAALFATLLVIPIVYLSVRAPSRLTRFIERSTYFGYSVPALAFALGLVFFSLRLAPALYQTLFLLVYAYTVHYMAEAMGPIRSALYQTSPKIEEAARSLGYSRIQAIFKVTFPLIRNGMLVSTAFVFLSCMKELHLTIILSPLGYNTLAVNVWSFIEEAFFAEAAPYALTILAFSGMFVGVLLLQERKYA
ncbi:MAG: iron ABC transporter permease [Candidatus Hydrogenedentota bacterium]|nr:MAG: iron ABC transporter permease [Candidatus Hydrogenedentota bacterium]